MLKYNITPYHILYDKQRDQSLDACVFSDNFSYLIVDELTRVTIFENNRLYVHWRRYNSQTEVQLILLGTTLKTVQQLTVSLCVDFVLSELVT